MIKKKSDIIIKHLYNVNNSYYKNKKKCEYCLDKNKINLFNTEITGKYLNSLQQIKNKVSNKICAKHQRYIRRLIIISRNLHLLPHIELND